VRLTATAGLVCALLLPACAPRNMTLPALSSGEASGAEIPLALREPASRPRVAQLTRSGDPEGAVTLAFAAPRVGPQSTWENLALATLLDIRLRGGGFRAKPSADAIGLRVTVSAKSADDARRMVRVLPAIVMAQVTDQEARLVVSRLERETLPTIPALANALAACSGDGGLAGGQGVVPVMTRGSLEALRSESLRRGAVAIGTVGPAELTAATSEELESGPAWPLREEAGPVRLLESRHATTIDGSTHSGATLDIAWPLASPGYALELAEAEQRHRSPLRAQLAVHDIGFSLIEARATARPDGGCLRLRFHASELGRERAPRQAAKVLELANALVRGASDARRELPPVAKTIASAPSASEAAELAAWWTLAGVATSPSDVGASSVLALPAQRGDNERTHEALEQEYLAALEATGTRSQGPAARRAELPLRASVEPGQGESWLLLASDCIAPEEGRWESGRGALGAHIASSFLADRNVAVEPWLRPEGIGLLVHGPKLTGETAEAAGRRLGEVLGMSVTSVPFSDARVARAQASLLPTLSSPSALRRESFLDRFDGHPASVWQPAGGLSRLLAVTATDAEERWRLALRATWRGAMLASVGEGEVRAAQRELLRWRPTPDGATCPNPVARPQGGVAQRVTTSLPDAFGVIAIPSHERSDWPLVEALAVTLTTTSRAGDATEATPLRDHQVRWLGGRVAPTLVVEFSGPQRAVEAAVASWQDRLDALRERGLPTEQVTAALDRLRDEYAVRHRSPRGRVEALWLGAAPFDVTPEGVTKWLRTNLAPERRDVLIGIPSGT
jgi:hypothetical protein